MTNHTQTTPPARILDLGERADWTIGLVLTQTAARWMTGRFFQRPHVSGRASGEGPRREGDKHAGATRCQQLGGLRSLSGGISAQRQDATATLPPVQDTAWSAASLGLLDSPGARDTVPSRRTAVRLGLGQFQAAGRLASCSPVE